MAVARRYRVLGDCVLLAPEPDPTYKEYMQYTHIEVPDAFKTGPIDPPKWGYILAFGPACRSNKVCWASEKTKQDCLLHLGDRVLYGKFSWAKLQVDEKTHYAIVREGDLLAVDTRVSHAQ